MTRPFSFLLAFLLVANVATAATPPPDDHKAARKATFKAGLKGCGLAALSALIGGGNAVKGCLAGGLVSGMAEHKQQVKAARALADDARKDGIDASVTTSTVNTNDKHGQQRATEALDQLVIALDPQRVANRDPGVSAILRKAALMADGSSTPVTLTVEGTKAQRAWIVGELRATLSPTTKATVITHAAGAPRLVLAPVPAVRHD